MTDSTPSFGHLTTETLALFTDRYELTTLQGYAETGHEPEATFSLFFRRLPRDRGYLVAARLAQAVAYLETLTFSDRAISHLESRGFRDEFLSRLASFEFTGDVRAVPEGTPVFPNEPLIKVTAPIFEAQLFETVLLNEIGFSSLVATKAARVRDVIDRAGDEQLLVDFGGRRAHGTDAGMKAARAAYLGGFAGTSNEAAAEVFEIPSYGTMAHSWVQSFPSERAAFEAFVAVYGNDAVLLIDTYDTMDGARVAVDVAEEQGVELAGVRLDSGDQSALSKVVADFVGDIGIFVSSDLDEYAIAEFLEDGGIATGFGPGTALTTSAGAPSLDVVYKLVAVERGGALAPTMKLSAGKVTYPGQKSVRRIESDEGAVRDVLGLRGESGTGRELLIDVFLDGERVYERPSLDAIRDRRRALAELPAGVREIRDPAEYPVAVSDALERRTRALRAALSAGRGH